MAIKLGITGGIGSGKSIVAHLLEVLGIPVYIADIEAKRLTNTDLTIRHKLCALLGAEVYQGDAFILNKPLLASYLFGHPDHAKQINEIIHPAVKEEFRRWVTTHATCPIMGMESAILIEAGFKSEVDLVVMVYAPVEVRIQRAINRDSSSRELIMKRIQSQMSDEQKREQADFVLVNDGEAPLMPQVLALISFLSKKSDYLCPAKNN